MGQKNSVKVFRNFWRQITHRVNLCLKSLKSRHILDIKWKLGTVWYEAKRISIQVQQDQCIGKSIFFVLVPSVWHRFLTPETPAKEIFAWETFWYVFIKHLVLKNNAAFHQQIELAELNCGWALSEPSEKPKSDWKTAVLIRPDTLVKNDEKHANKPSRA